MATNGPDAAQPRPGETGVFDERANTEVVASLVANLQAMVKTQIELAKLEIVGIVRDKAIALGLLAFAGLLGIFVLAFAGVTGANALMLVLPGWAAWLIVTGIYLLVLLVLALVGIKLVKRPVVPEQTKTELETTKQWATEQVQG